MPSRFTIHISKTTIIRRYSPDSVKFDDAKPSTLDQINAGDQLRARGISRRHRTGGGSGGFWIIPEHCGRRSALNRCSKQHHHRNGSGNEEPVTLRPADSQLRKLPHGCAADCPAMRGAASRAPAAGGGSSAPAKAGEARPNGGAGGCPGGTPDFQQMLKRRNAGCNPRRFAEGRRHHGCDDGRQCQYPADRDHFVKRSRTHPFGLTQRRMSGGRCFFLPGTSEAVAPKLRRVQHHSARKQLKSFASGNLMKSGRSRSSVFIFVTLFVLLVLTGSLPAQTASGTLRGRVTDPSRRGADNSHRNGARDGSAVTDNRYVRTQRIGTYTITTSAKGFAVSTEQNFAISADQLQRVDIALAVGLENRKKLRSGRKAQP